MSKILIEHKSDSIGDTIVVLPYVKKFFDNNQNTQVDFSINDWLIKYLKPSYPEINFIGRNFLDNYNKKIFLDYFNSSLPLQKYYASKLGFQNAEYLRPELIFNPLDRPIKNKYVTIGIHSTAQLKYWNHPDGIEVQPESPNWNKLCILLRNKGFTPVVVEQYEFFGSNTYKNGLPKKANKKFGQSFEETLNYIYHSEFYIGLSSGLSWVAHSLGKPVAMISNFTQDWFEFDLNSSDYIRITNKSVCHGCWNKINKDFVFDRYDWYWCPLHKNTPRQFECHTSITPDYVIDKIQKWLV